MTPDAVRILAAIHRHRSAFDLSADNLGESLCRAFTDGVAARIAAEQAPDGTPWPDLSPEYAEEKAKRFPGKSIGERLGLMTDPMQVAGDVIVLDGATAFVTYGTTEEARAEAAAFQEGDPGQNRPPRPFWGFTPTSTVATQQILVDRLKTVVG